MEEESADSDEASLSSAGSNEGPPSAKRICIRGIVASNREVDISDDVLREVIGFARLIDLGPWSMVARRFSMYCDPLRHIFQPHVVEPLMITGRRNARGETAGNQIRFRHRIWGNNLELANVAPPLNITSFEYISINDFIGPETVEFLKVSKELFRGCSLEFHNLASFLDRHSDEFVDDFLAIFAHRYLVRISAINYRLAPFLKKLIVSDCKRMVLGVSGNFDFSCLIPWLCPEGRKRRPSRYLVINGRDTLPSNLMNFVEEIIQVFLNTEARFKFFVKLNSPSLLPEFTMQHPTGEHLRFQRDFLGDDYSYMLRRFNEDSSEEEGGDGDDDGDDLFWTDALDVERTRVVVGTF